MRNTIVTLVALLTPWTAAAAQGNYQLYGTGCPGAAGVPKLAAQGTPTLGESFGITLSAAPAGVPAVLLFGGAQLAVPFGACTLLASPDVAVPLVADGQGKAALPLSIPYDGSLAGGTFYNQWLVVDGQAPRGLTMSNGGCARLAASPLELLSVSAANPAVGGPPFALIGRNLGNDPDDLCVQVLDRVSGPFLIRARALKSSGGIDTATVQLATGVRPGSGPVVVMRGEGATVPVKRTQHLAPPAEAWGWRGWPIPGGSASGPDVFATPAPGKTPFIVPAVVSPDPTSSQDIIVFSLSSVRGACNPGLGGSDTFPVGTVVSLVAHWATEDCKQLGQALEYYDLFLFEAEVVQELTCDELVQELAAQLTEIANTAYPNGGPLVGYGACWMFIKMTDTTCVGSNLSGYLSITCPC